MQDKLKKLIEAYEELEKKLVDPAVVSDPKEYARLAKEHSNQAELAGKAREYLGALDDIEAAREMQRETTDPDEKALLQADRQEQQLQKDNLIAQKAELKRKE